MERAYQISVHESEDPIRAEHDIRPGWILVEDDLCLFELREPISQLIVDWKSAAKNLRKAGGGENFWKADTYAYCAHRLELVLDSDRCLECGESNGKHLPGCKIPKFD